MCESGVCPCLLAELSGDGILLYPSHRHAQILIQSFGMESCKCAPTPIAREDEADAEREEMDEAKARFHLGGVARLMYLAQDTVDLSVAACKLAPSMAQPRKGDEIRLKRPVRYLRGRPGYA